MRLDKYLADMGSGSRKELKRRIRSGEVRVGEETVIDPAFPVDPTDPIFLGGKRVVYETAQYFMLYKPEGVITAVRDKHKKTVMDLLPEERRGDLFPVGRLDRDTTGLLLITNDGDLAHRLLSPKLHVEKVYRALIRGEVTGREISAFREGLTLRDGLKCLPAGLRILGDIDLPKEGWPRPDFPHSLVEVRITEGKYHEIKRMFLSVGMEVLRLKRVSMGSLVLDPGLKAGEVRPLREDEIRDLKIGTGSLPGPDRG